MKTKFVLLLFLLSCLIIYPQKEISITIDDLPVADAASRSAEEQKNITVNLLEKLKEHSVPAIGFVNEEKLYTDGELDNNLVELLQLWLDTGLELGNHTYSHKSLNRVTPEEFKNEIDKGDKITKELMSGIGKKPQYFRHPYLHTGRSLEVKNEIEKYLEIKGYKVAPVSVDNSEWIFAAAYNKAEKAGSKELMEKIGEAYIPYMRDKILYFENRSESLFGYNIKQILLIHANRLNSDYFDELAVMIKELGYSFISLNEALKDDAYNSKDEFIKNGGISWIHRWAITQNKPKEFFAGEPAVPQFILDAAGIENE